MMIAMTTVVRTPRNRGGGTTICVVISVCFLLEPKCIYWLQSRSCACGPDTEHDTDNGTESESQRDGAAGDGECPPGDRRDERGNPKTNRKANETADDGKHYRLDEELREDLTLLCTDRAANPDLARAFTNRHQHDVHDADSANHEADGGDSPEQQRERANDAVERADE
jgi:hypothetical protein